MVGHLASGSVFAGDFRIVRQLADGGMGTVYVAEQLSTGKRRALKLLKSELAGDPKTFARFEQEARVASLIQSEHVVEVIAAGLDPATRIPWLAMELLEGADLGALVARRGPLPPADARELFSQLCHALGAAHRAGVVHRDLKPENVFVANAHQRFGRFRVVVLDFGIAKVVEAARANSPATTALGTPRWMSPEQADGRGEVTPAADVWALGLLVFYLLTGRPFWENANGGEGAHVMALMREILFDPIPTASARGLSLRVAHLLPKGFDAWFGRCLEREPGARFSDATAAMEALDPLLAQPSLPPASSGALAPVPYEPWPSLTPSLSASARTGSPSEIPSQVARPRSKFVLLGSIGAALVVAFATATFLVARAIPPADPPKVVELPVDLNGAYAITSGKTPMGGLYGGSVLMTRMGEPYRVAWTIANNPGYEGVALLTDRTLGVGWGMPGRYGVVVYVVEGRKLRGRWTTNEGRGVGTEDLEGPATLSGSFTITRSSSGATGKVTITPKGDLFELTWSTSKGRAVGVGIRSRDQLVAGFSPLGPPVGVVAYEIPPARPRGKQPAAPTTLTGRWAVTGWTKVGTETIVRR